jgi:multidrug efflux pump subunit AcrB
VVPISAVADVVETVATDNIRRINGRRTVTLNIIPPRSVALEEGVEIVRKEVVSQLQDSGRIPYDVAVDISGASDQLQATREALGGNFVVAVILAYLLMVAVFVHWGYPMLIMATVPLGIAGGILGLWALNGISGGLSLLGFATVQQPFDMITMLGFLILLGTVVNNPILIVDHTRYELRETGCDPATAIRRAVEVRLRPILMTTVTTLFGLSPLVFIPGAGTELYRGVGVVVMAGLLCAMLVTLVFLPALLMLVLQARERWRSRRFSTP